MKFRVRSFREEPEINFIPWIDVLLVILIFLIITTTYTKKSELQINLPTAEASKQPEHAQQIDVAIDSNANYVINKTPVAFNNREGFAQALKKAAGSMRDPVVVISADAKASHQSVIHVMEAAQFAGYGKITFSTDPTHP